jgi:transposase InsO family protein
MLRDHGITTSMDGRGRCHDNIFVERLRWTVKHEWVYLRPAANGTEQKRSLGEFFDWYNLQPPHQGSAGEHRTRRTLANRRRRRRWPPDTMPRRCREFVVVGCADPRLTAAHELHSTPQQDRMNLISGER